LDKQLVALALALPSEDYIQELLAVVDPVAVHRVREFMQKALAEALKNDLLKTYHDNQVREAYAYRKDQIKKRSLRNFALAYLSKLKSADIISLIAEQYHKADNMTDTRAALSAINDIAAPERESLLADFYGRWKDNPNVILAWFSLQASSEIDGALQRVKQAMHDPVFDIKNANMVRSLIGAFCGSNIAFYAGDASGYRFWADQIIDFNVRNKKIAATLAKNLCKWKSYHLKYQAQIKPELERAFAMPGITDDVYEVLKNLLG
jgi:aminopeptidase N